MLGHLDAQPAGTVVVLHACCHNPTGQDLSPAQWAEVAAVVARRGLMPFMDLAYQGLGEDLDRDAASVRLMARAVPEMLVAVSCSKNFGIYRERTGLLIALSSDGERAGITTGHLGRLARTLWSMPPDHGAALVERVLSQPALRQDWMTELSHMASRINNLRSLLADRLSAVSGVDYRWIAAQRGMFSRLPLTAEQVAFARDHHHLYMPPDGRINLAGVSPANVDRVAAGLIAAVHS
jgi:aromatic-amino-acid transaminase